MTDPIKAPAPPSFKFSRRKFIAAAAGTAAAAPLAARAAGEAPSPATTSDPSAPVDLALRVNGSSKALHIDACTTVLDALREHIGLNGTKKDCDHGQCGACTVLIDGRRVLSCLTLAVSAQSQEILTIEGLATGDELHPMQQAFVDQDAFQCGYCTPGQIMSAVGCVQEGHAGNDDDIREYICVAAPPIRTSSPRSSRRRWRWLPN